MARLITFLGWVFGVLGGGAILLGLVGIAMTQGIAAALEVANPFNVWNMFMMLVALAPSYFLITWGKKLKEKQRTQDS